MEVSAHAYLVLLAFTKLTAFGSVSYIILKISKNNCFSESMNYYKAYFIVAFILTFLNMIFELYHLKEPFNISLFLYFSVTFILLLAMDERHRTRLRMSIYATILLGYLLSSIYFELTFMQILIFHAIGSIILYTLLLMTSINKAKQLNNIGLQIMSFAFVVIIAFALVELVYIYLNNSDFVYLLAISSANVGFLLVIIGFLAQILISEYNQLNTIALTDPLTNMNNRRGLYHLLESVMPSSNRHNRCFSIITMDIDFFKKVNDTYGHDGGDIVLQAFSKMIKETHRNTDISARLGGEEFILILPDTDKEKAIIIAEKLRTNTEKLNIDFNGQTINITSSFGLDTSCDQFNIDELFKNADKALYESKFSGRNKVTHFDNILN